MKKIYKIGIISIILALLGSVVYAAQSAGQKSVLSGVVTSVIQEGQHVKEGDILVTVDSLAGPVPAVRATGDGVVNEVKVQEGTEIKQGDVAVILEI